MFMYDEFREFTLCIRNVYYTLRVHNANGTQIHSTLRRSFCTHLKTLSLRSLQFSLFQQNVLDLSKYILTISDWVMN